jgi:drug/metabolite transporter (DMT)-like permease
LWNESRKEKEGLLESNTTENDQNKEVTPFHLAIPALCDFFGSTIMTFGLTMMAPSIYQMFRGSLIFFTALFSVIFLKNKLYRHNLLALFLVISGLILVGTSALIHNSSDSASHNTVVGIVLVIIAQLFSATQFIVEEKFMKGYHCHPLKAVGWEGIWGSGLYLILLIIFQFIPCEPETSFSKNVCSVNEKEEWLLEDTLFAFRQIGANGPLLFYVILYICSIALFNFVGISVAKYASSPARAVVDTVRTIVVWGFFLIPFSFVEKSHRETFSYLQLVGFILVVLGTVIYNEVLILRFLGFDKDTKEAIKKREAIGPIGI